MTVTNREKQFIVKLQLPSDATIKDAQEYLLEAITTWQGQLRPAGAYDATDPGHPMWMLDPDTVSVTHATKYLQSFPGAKARK